MAKSNQNFGVSVGLPWHIVDEIDKMRGDIPRAKYLRKFIIIAVEKEKTQGKQA